VRRKQPTVIDSVRAPPRYAARAPNWRSDVVRRLIVASPAGQPHQPPETCSRRRVLVS